MSIQATVPRANPDKPDGYPVPLPAPVGGAPDQDELLVTADLVQVNLAVVQIVLHLKNPPENLRF
jgi:hypothetical protein